MIDLKGVTNLPSSSGIYQFLAKRKPIYIGKSVNIKARVLSHIKAAEISKKENLIIEHADEVIFIETISDFDAIVLEAHLIKKYKPHYNIALKDDKHFLYIKITIKEKYPKIFLVRAENDGISLYFGPFNSTQMTESLLYHIRRIIPFCTQKMVREKSCFYSKIGICNPCPSFIESCHDKEKTKLQREYKNNIKMIISMLKGYGTRIIDELNVTLKYQTKCQDFEGAIETRDKLLGINTILYSRSFSTFDTQDFSRQSDIERELRVFLRNSFDKDIVENTYRIECFDMSTLFGHDSTGSMVVFENGTLKTDEYRRFKIKSGARSDFDRMKEVLMRRFAKDEWRMPDILIVDGGKPQVRIASQVMSDLQLDIPIIGLAKNPDRIVFNENNIRPVEKTSTLFKTFQLLRDESHRFAKKYHLLLRHSKLML